ncbi:hypothetical protein [Ethanoligenens sp.]|uniref:hypothetical protein n=1 Tax=Ethanoligenens sp. TaxID=2099655 RepID=UPI0039ED5298
MPKWVIRFIHSKDGNMYPLVAAYLLLAMFLLGVSMELWRGHAVTTGAYNAVRAAVSDTVTKNAANLYSAQTDMAADAYTYTDNGWTAQTDTSTITNTLQNHLGLRQSGSDWVCYDSGGHELYRLSGLTVQVTNPYTPQGSPSSASKYTVTVTWTLNYTFLNIMPMSTPMKASASTGGKF